jgi:ATP-dependent protease ClpP protease subunit
MKKFLLIVCTVALIATGCASMGAQSERNVFKHELELTVKADEKATVNVEQDKPKYALLNSPMLHPTQLTALSHDKAFTKIFSGLSVSDVTRLWTDITYLLEMTDIREMHMFINSPGGDAFSGLALADIIINAQNRGLKIIAHANGIIASAAVPVFAVCEYRIAAPGTIFMVHEAALWKWPGRETSSDIRAQNELMVQLQNKYLGYLVRNSNLSLGAWIEKEKKTTWFNTERAMEWGLVDEID